MSKVVKQPLVASAMVVPAPPPSNTETKDEPGTVNKLVKTLKLAVRHTSLLFLIWLAVLVGKYFIEGTNPSKLLNKTNKIVAFLTIFFVVDVFIITHWPKMSQNLIQAGMYYICTILFACLKI
ncbi:hypothetical protein TetV_592 [Tetraselmis virus 1]|uniref:Uncharacterized protein n=1 Tax=Tetraselmis virus 1 TaxID=2060617 RepID=A0A2P0VP46_9VIRU|nr:hypothetical protein QJ968_gp462 [Tetraselmis virus 1]AUF82674.1 hypothetical protein TetV_592 [Tetraselmis virus 1]